MTWPSYDLHQLIEDVAALLHDQGIEVTTDPASQQRRETGAAYLLSGLCVTPTLHPGRALDLDGHAHYNRTVHGD